MVDASTSVAMSPELTEVAVRAKRDPKHRFLSLAHLIDVSALTRAFTRIRSGAAVGVDGVTKSAYGQKLSANLKQLHERMKAQQYRHQPIRRVHIPKGEGKTRPIGVSTVEDKIVQGALTEVLEAICEQDFLSCSYGFRPRRGAHDAIRTLSHTLLHDKVNWVLEADIRDFFGSLDRKWLMKMLQERITDGSFLRLVGKCLNVGVLDGAEFSSADQGTTQGSAISPMLGNIYLHYVLDLWFERKVKPRLHGAAQLVRYADDFVICFELQVDAKRVMDQLPERFGKFNLTLHPDKTRLLFFRRPDLWKKDGKGPNTFDFLGFTLYWRRTRRGHWMVGFKTRAVRLRQALKNLTAWCRDHRHFAVAEQHRSLVRRIQGHFNYFGVNGNLRSLAHLVDKATRIWFKWLRRRSQRSRLTWKRFNDFLKAFPLPKPRIVVRIWA